MQRKCNMIARDLAFACDVRTLGTRSVQSIIGAMENFRLIAVTVLPCIIAAALLPVSCRLRPYVIAHPASTMRTPA